MSSFASAQVSKVEASIDKNPVMLDESFTLTVTADGDVERDAFDSSPLLSTFVVGRTSVSSQTRMVNFQTSRSTTWSTTLFPRATGDFTIPTFTIAGQTSQPITVSVVPVSAGSNSESRDVFVTTELDQDSVYLHQQVKYSVKLYLAREIERGSLQAPELSNAEIQQIGKDAEYTEILNGKRYRVIKRDFVIIPQRSGEFTITGPVFQGDVIANSRQSFGFFNRTESVSRVGPTQTLNVLPIPSNVNGVFLPSEFVDLHQEWSNQATEWRVGEPVTRTITLTAVGLTESILPEINDEYPPDIKTYPDQANTTTAENEQSLVAQRVESIALIPSRSGQFVIPPVTVEWFNVVTETIEIAELPAQAITVLPATNAANTSNPPLTQSTELDTPQTASDALQSNPINRELPIANADEYIQQIEQLKQQIMYWQLATASLVALVIVIAAVYMFTRSKAPAPNKPKLLPQNDVEKQYWQNLAKHITEAEPTKIKRSLLSWLQCVLTTESNDTEAILKRLGQHDICEQLNTMFASQYSQSKSNWQHQTLQQQLTLLRNHLLKQQRSPLTLKPLYPE